MTFEEYESQLDAIASTSLDSQRSAHELVGEHPNRDALAKFRLSVLIDADVCEWRDILLTGLFRKEKPEVRLGLILVTLDVENQCFRKDLRRQCCEYKDSSLLAKIPALHNVMRDDLIAADAFEQLNDSDIVQLDGGFARLDTMLHPRLVAWVLGSFPRKTVAVRLDPRYGGPNKMEARLNEYVDRPPNPKWWKRLCLHRGTTDGATYVLDPDSTESEFRERASWEYKAKGIRRLEVFVKRENQGRLSMMIEELSNRYERNGILLGRCIHLDSSSPVGTHFSDAELDHIDIALNVYENGVRRKRLGERLHDGGKIEKASYRTHLLRIDNAPFTALFDLVVGFLQSSVLWNEWFTSQFGQNVPVQ